MMGGARAVAGGSALVAWVALFLNLLVWSLYAPAMAVGIDTPICTIADAGVPAVAGDDPGHVNHSDGSLRHCPLGLLAGGLATAPSTTPAPVPSVLRVAPEVPEQRPVATPARFNGWNARAPPRI